MSKKSTMSAASVLTMLRAKHFSGGAYTMLHEVRNTTGYSSRIRSADALVVSCWPSRGLWFAGIEVKVQRSDWLNELKNPAKSAEIQRYCHYWWIATPPGVVESGELPETWGHIEVTPKERVVMKEAPRLEAQEPTIAFIASVMRNMGGNHEALLQKEYQRGKDEALNGADDPEVEALQKTLARERQGYEYAKRTHEELRSRVAAFEQKTGLSVEHDWMDESRKLVPAAKALLQCDTSLLEERLMLAAQALREVREAATLKVADGEAAQ